MRRFATVLAALVLLMSAPVMAQPTDPRPARLSVNGVGSVSRSPDEAIVSFTIVTDDPNAARAASANNATYTALLGKLRALGIPASAIRTTGYSLRYNPRPPHPNPQSVERYGSIVSRNVTVTSDRTDQAGPIVDAAVAAGVSDIGDVAFAIRDQRAAYRDALAAAVADAQAQAQTLAGATHVRLGRILAVTPSSPIIPVRESVLLSRSPAAAAPPIPTDVQPSDLTVRATVTLTYAIAP
jgi:uncharacterized protein YggE